VSDPFVVHVSKRKLKAAYIVCACSTVGFTAVAFMTVPMSTRITSCALAVLCGGLVLMGLRPARTAFTITADGIVTRRSVLIRWDEIDCVRVFDWMGDALLGLELRTSASIVHRALGLTDRQWTLNMLDVEPDEILEAMADRAGSSLPTIEVG
jgi:hypothetical protein